MDLWQTRSESLRCLGDELSHQKFILEQCFHCIDQCVGIFEEKSKISEPHKICAITLLKARNYALGAYGLILDGLGQEAGALMRPMVEFLELMKYFRSFPQDIELVFTDILPKAGIRAKKINGIHKGLREHFNAHSSHSSFSEHSINHLFESDGIRFRREQPFIKATLFRNLGDLFAELFLLIRESVLCVDWLESGITEDLADFVDALHAKGMTAFRINDRINQS